MDKNLKPIYIKLGLNIAYYRKLRKMSQKNLAAAIGVETSHISKIEKAACAPSSNVLIKIMLTLNVNMDKLFDLRE